MTNDIRNQIEIVVQGLSELAKEVVFVGGCLPIFYVDQAKFDEPRPTEDIDCIIKVASLAAHHILENELRNRGFVNEASMIARWAYKGIIVDIMPTHGAILGFSNSWYEAALRDPVTEILPGGTTCQILSIPYFFATKFEALANRGGDLRMSKDIEDIIYVLNGCESVVAQITSSHDDVRQFIGSSLSQFLAQKNCEEIVDAHLSRASRARKEIVLRRMAEIVAATLA